MKFETLELWRKLCNFMILVDTTNLGSTSLYDRISKFPARQLLYLSELGIKMFGTQVGSPHCEFTILKVERFAKLML